MQPDASTPVVTCPLCRHSPCVVTDDSTKKSHHPKQGSDSWATARTLTATCPNCGAGFQITSSA